MAQADSDDGSSLASQPSEPKLSMSVIGADAASEGSQYAMFSMHKWGTVRFLQFPKSIYAPDRYGPVLSAAWPQGIAKSGYYASAYEYRMRGHPFAFGKESSVQSRRLVRNTLAYLYESGWILQTAYTNSRRPTTKDTLLFKKSERANLPEVDWIVVMTSRSDRLRIIADPPSQKGAAAANSSPAKGTAVAGGDVNPGKAAVDALHSALQRAGFLSAREENFDSVEFNLQGNPWWATGKNTVQTRLIMLRMVEALDQLGWRVYGTVHQRSENDDSHKADTWYFVRARDWVGGSPFNAEPVRAALG